MRTIKIPYKETGYFSKTMIDYLDEKASIRSFYHRFPSIENFEAQIQEKGQSHPLENRKMLANAIELQYQNINTSALTKSHIDSLVLPNTFTITTGHQLNIFSGPLYFLYKIVSVINLCKELSEKYPKQNFVPVYWMASEDHDFEEIQYFNHKGKKLSWEKEASGAVGRLSTEGLDVVFEAFSDLLNNGENAEFLKDLFEKAYLEQDNLSEASRYLVNELFKDKGLVIVDGDDEKLKALFKPYTIRELEEHITFKKVTETNTELEKEEYKIQVNPREINLFHLTESNRERIIESNEKYKAVELSPNALLRPLYQEIILPNLCYIGGGGELAYWLQLKTTFKAFGVTFPMLLLRNSALLMSEKQFKKTEKLGVRIEDLFLSQNKLIKKKVKQLSSIDFNFEERKQLIQQNFTDLKEIAKQTDASFAGAVEAQEMKQIRGLVKLEKRLLKAEKKKLYDTVTRLELLQNELFPNHSLEERQRNFAEFYEAYGQGLIKSLFESLKPLDPTFTVITL